MLFNTFFGRFGALLCESNKMPWGLEVWRLAAEK
jgi:hypothetical protein